jgi:acetyl esterase/lipase
MKLLKLTLLNFLLILSVNSCSEENPNNGKDLDNNLNPAEYYEELNIEYGNDINQKFDLYLPSNRTNTTKTMILVHGGGWSSGDKIDMNGIKDLVRQDFPNVAVVNINYRLADANNRPYPMQIDDISAIINYLKNRKADYTISEKFGFIGISAGAHLSLLWCYAFDTNTNSNMVCSIVGPTNLTDPAYLENTDPALQQLLNLYGDNLDLPYLEEASPYHRVTASATPTILFYGGQDPLIPTSQGIDLRDKLLDLNVVHEFTLYPDASHGFGLLELLDTWAKIKVFIQTHL